MIVAWFIHVNVQQQVPVKWIHFSIFEMRYIADIQLTWNWPLTVQCKYRLNIVSAHQSERQWQLGSTLCCWSQCWPIDHPVRCRWHLHCTPWWRKFATSINIPTKWLAVYTIRRGKVSSRNRGYGIKGKVVGWCYRDDLTNISWVHCKHIL